MESRIKELIAVGASVTANCMPCFEYHVREARKFGAEDGEIREAIAVAKMVRKGAAGKMDKFVLGVLDATPAADAGDGCGGREG